SNQLGPDVKNLVGNADPTRADYGFGLGLAVRTTPGIVRMMGSVGDFSWPGASGTNWWADPREELTVVWMAHSPGSIRWKYRQMINERVYQALVDETPSASGGGARPRPRRSVRKPRAAGRYTSARARGRGCADNPRQSVRRDPFRSGSAASSRCGELRRRGARRPASPVAAPSPRAPRHR